MQEIIINVLGCGSSSGVPLIGCECNVCISNDLRNIRTRTSSIITINGKSILIDASPDLRQQFLREKIRTIDGVIFTHAHADHCLGIDDLRTVNYYIGGALDIYATPDTMLELQRIFAYAFLPIAKYKKGWVRPSLTPNLITKVNGVYPPFHIKGFGYIQPFEQIHGKIKTLGYRIGDFAYSTDVSELPQHSLKILQGIKFWLVDCLREESAPTHANLEQTLKWIDIIKPERAALIHMAHEVDYSSIAKKLPSNVQPAYDGLKIIV